MVRSMKSISRRRMPPDYATRWHHGWLRHARPVVGVSGPARFLVPPAPATSGPGLSPKVLTSAAAAGSRRTYGTRTRRRMPPDLILQPSAPTDSQVLSVAARRQRSILEW